MNSLRPDMPGASSDWAGRARQHAARWGQRVWLIVTVVVLVVMVAFALYQLYPRLTAAPGKAAAIGDARELSAAAMVVRDLGPADGGQHRYDVTYTATLRNGSDSDYIVPWSLDELFLGQFQPSAGGAPAVINPPPKPIADPPVGAIAWKLAQSQASYLWTEEGLDLGDDNIDENDVINYLKEAHLDTKNANSGLIGRFQPGAARSHVAHYQFEASPDSYVAVMISYGIETRAPLFGDSPDYLWDTQHNRVELVRLKDATDSPCRLGVKVENGRLAEACAPGAGSVSAATRDRSAR